MGCNILDGVGISKDAVDFNDDHCQEESTAKGGGGTLTLVLTWWMITMWNRRTT